MVTFALVMHKYRKYSNQYKKESLGSNIAIGFTLASSFISCLYSDLCELMVVNNCSYNESLSFQMRIIFVDRFHVFCCPYLPRVNCIIVYWRKGKKKGKIKKEKERNRIWNSYVIIVWVGFARNKEFERAVQIDRNSTRSTSRRKINTFHINLWFQR